MENRLILAVLLLVTCSAALATRLAAQELPLSIEDPELRFQFMAHNFSTNGVEQEIYLKLDRFTGKTWRYHASNPRWEPIPEAKNGRPRGASGTSRYELLSHDYFDDKGEAKELYLRVDMVTGYSWTYQGIAESWTDVPQTD
jgi:hypothetical protein